MFQEIVQKLRSEIIDNNNNKPGPLRSHSALQASYLCNFGSATCVPVSWMCKKQTSVSHSSTDSEIISLDAGLRMDGLPAHDLWGHGD